MRGASGHHFILGNEPCAIGGRSQSLRQVLTTAPSALLPSRECQRAAWPTHKALCKQLQAQVVTEARSWVDSCVVALGEHLGGDGSDDRSRRSVTS